MQQLQRHPAAGKIATRKACIALRGPRPFGSRSLRPAAPTMGATAAADMALVERLKQSPFPPHTPLAGSIAGSFAEATISKRLPAILDTIIRDLLESAAAAAYDAATAAQFQAAAGSVEQLKQLILSDAELQPLAAPPAACPALAAAAASTNACLQAWVAHSGAATWLSLPWLTIECYMYVWINVALQQQPALAAQRYDPFRRQKLAAFLKSRGTVGELAGAVRRLLRATGPGVAREELRQQCFEVVQYALWGNKTDLSLLVDVAQVDAAQLAAQVGAQQASPFLLADDFEQLWQHLAGASARAPGGLHVDLVLDNSGVELFSDLCLADFLLASGLAASVAFHGKPLPWFVSDVLGADFSETIGMCAAPEACGLGAAGEEGAAAVAWLGARWKGYVADGRWRYTDDPFWCTPHPFWWMEAAAPALHRQLAQRSGLLVFKGDLNYRKLAADCQWPWHTPFEAALGPFRPAPLVTLRTLKADVLAGLRPGQGEALAQVDAGWLVSGKYGVVQFAHAQP